MIKINLATRKSASLMAGEGGGTSVTRMGGLGGLKNINVQDIARHIADIPNLRLLILFCIVVYGGNWWFDSFRTSELSKAQAEITKLKDIHVGLKKELEGSKKYEAIKKSLEEDETVIRQKVEVMQKLVSDRSTPPKLLMALSNSIPKDVWLSEIRIETNEIQLKGDSVDFNQVSEFMKSLGESAYFRDVTLKTTQQGKDESGMEVAKFDLGIKRR